MVNGGGGPSPVPLPGTINNPQRQVRPQQLTESAPLLAAPGAIPGSSPPAPCNARCRRTLSVMTLGSAVVAVGIILYLFRHHLLNNNNDDDDSSSRSSIGGANHTGNGHSFTSLRPPSSRHHPTPSSSSSSPSSSASISTSASRGSGASSREAGFGTLIFHEEFLGSKLNENTWNIERTLGGGGNWEFQDYTAEAITVEGGLLKIQPGLFKDLGEVRTEAGLYDAAAVMVGDCKPWPNCSTYHVPGCTNPMWLGCKRIGGDPKGNIINPVTSARINSRGKFSFKYGRLEFTARLPRGDFLWPALWLLPEDEVYGGWPASGEIDIMESRGNKPGYTVGGEQAGYDAFGSTLHYGNIEYTDQGDSILLDGWRNAHAVVTHPDGGDFTAGFNIFGLYWDEEEMYTYTVAKNGSEVMVLNLTAGYQNGFWAPPLGGEGDPLWFDNPYKKSPNKNAPFDQAFFLIINLAVGGQEGNLGYWQDAPWAGCHQSDHCYTQGAFWDKRDLWLPSWEKAKAEGAGALVIDSIKVWQQSPQQPHNGGHSSGSRATPPGGVDDDAS